MTIQRYHSWNSEDDEDGHYVAYDDYAELESAHKAALLTISQITDVTGTSDTLSISQQVAALAAESAQMVTENEYIRKRFKELDLMFGKNLLVMQAAIIEWRATGDAKNGMEWIFSTLLGPDELPSEEEKDAQAYFDREYEPIDAELMELHRWFYESRKRAEVVPIKPEVAAK